MKERVSWAVLALACALGTVSLGWWTVPVLAAIWGLVAAPATGAGWRAGLAATVAWAALLVVTASPGRLIDLAEKLGGVAGVSGVIPIILTLLFPATLSATAATLFATLRREFRSRPGLA